MITYSEGGIEHLDAIEPLVKKLSDYHKGRSIYFSKDFEKSNFNNRKHQLNLKELVRVMIAYDDFKPIGYLVSSVDQSLGTIESLFVDEDFRGRSIADHMMSATLVWIKSFKPEAITVSVAYGNQVLSFYERYGFFPRSIILKDLDMTS